MLRQAPPLEATEAFLMAARSVSFRSAAQALALSPSAFSRRIQALESFLGIALFDRSGTGVVLTPAGLRYRDQIEPALAAIRRATQALRQTARERRLRVATSHSLAVGWLVPRLAQLQRCHGIELDLVITRDPQVLRSGAADLAIWGGFEADCGIPGEMLVELAAVPVAAARLADGGAPPSCLASLARHRLLGVKTPEGVWKRWLAATGHLGDTPEPAALFDTNDLMYEAAACGLGVALGVPLLVERFVRNGRLRPCAGDPVALGMGYSVYHASAEARARGLTCQFIHWLRHEVAASLAEFDEWCARPAPASPACSVPLSTFVLEA